MAFHWIIDYIALNLYINILFVFSQMPELNLNPNLNQNPREPLGQTESALILNVFGFDLDPHGEKCQLQ